MQSDDNDHDSTPRSQFSSRRLRNTSYISPRTGERSKRVFTLREASHRLLEDGNINESTPLLHGGDEGRNRESRLEVWRRYLKKQWLALWNFWTSKTGIGIFKCSLAYLLGSLATLVPAISAFIGPQQDSKHLVASITVWFHPARTIGSMHEVRI
nr:hypothetical protein CFP56_70506 [Quercus suber]